MASSIWMKYPVSPKDPFSSARGQFRLPIRACPCADNQCTQICADGLSRAWSGGIIRCMDSRVFFHICWSQSAENVYHEHYGGRQHAGRGTAVHHNGLGAFLPNRELLSHAVVGDQGIHCSGPVFTSVWINLGERAGRM